MSHAQVKHAVLLIRSHLASVSKEETAILANGHLELIIKALREEFLAEYDIPGTRYWYISPGEIFFVTAASELTPDTSKLESYQELFELDRTIWLGKQCLVLDFDGERL